MLATTADGNYRQRGRSRVTRSLPAGSEIICNRLTAADKAAAQHVAPAAAQKEDPSKGLPFKIGCMSR